MAIQSHSWSRIWGQWKGNEGLDLTSKASEAIVSKNTENFCFRQPAVVFTSPLQGTYEYPHKPDIVRN